MTPVKRVGRRAIVGSVLVPLVLFAGVTTASEAISPARGVPLLPTLPTITTQHFSGHVTIESYFQDANAGGNVLHIFITAPLVPLQLTATGVGPDGHRATFTAIRLGPTHFEALGSLTAGTWAFTVRAIFPGRTATERFSQSIE